MFILSLKCETNVDNFYGEKDLKGRYQMTKWCVYKTFFPVKAVAES